MACLHVKVGGPEMTFHVGVSTRAEERHPFAQKRRRGNASLDDVEEGRVAEATPDSGVGESSCGELERRKHGEWILVRVEPPGPQHAWIAGHPRSLSRIVTIAWRELARSSNHLEDWEIG